MSKKASSKLRYQPVAEFDDFTLARKREYWRSKKREQRARKSSARKEIRNENLGSCKQTISISTVRDEDFSETPKVSSDPSLHNFDVSCKLDDVDTAKNSFGSGLLISESNVACQTERCFHKNKLDHVLPQIPEAHTIFFRSNKKVVRDPITESSNIGGTMVDQSKSLYSTCNSLLMANSKIPHKTGASALNWCANYQLETPQQNLVAPSYNNQNKPYIKKCLPLQPLTIDQDFVGSKSPMTSRKTCDRNPSRAETIRIGMTEEELAAKRRENWRVKKREQRAKHAAKHAMNRERSLGQDQSSHTSIVYSSSLVNCCKALRGIDHKSVKSVSLSQGSLGKKNEEYQASAINTTQFVWATKPNRYPNGTQTVSKHKGQKRKFPHTLKKCRQKFLLGVTKVESAEDRHAKQKEYWRIKKREQRARLSAEGKTRLFEHRAEHYRSSFDHTCEVQSGCQKDIQSTEETFASSSETIGDFIKDDGTVCSSKTFEASLATTYEFPNMKRIEKVKFQIEVSSPSYPDASSVLKSGVQNKPVPHISTDFLSSHKKSVGHHFSSTSQVNCMDRRMLTIQSERLTEEKRNARIRENWRVKKREQRARRASRVRHGLRKSKISVVKQTKQNHRSTKGFPSMMFSHSVNSSANTRVCDTSTIAPVPKATIKQEQICPSIQAVFSLSEMYPFINVNQKIIPSTYTLNETAEAVAEADHNATTLQAVASMKKLLEESFSTVEDRTATNMHMKCENEPVTFKTESDLSEDVAPSAEQNISLQCDISNTNHKKDLRLSPSLYHSPSWTSSEYTIHHKSHNLSKGSAQPLCRDNQKLCNDRIDPKQCCPSQALQERQLGENCKLQRKREYWRLMKRQQRARKAKTGQGSKNAALQNLGSQPEQIRDGRSQNHHLPSDRSQRFPCSNNDVYTTGTTPSTLLLRPIISTQHPSKDISLLPAEDPQSETYQAPQEKPWLRQLSDTSPVMQSLSQDAATYRQIPMQNKTKMFAKPAGSQIQPADLFISKSTPNPEEDLEEVIHRRRMHWRIKKQQQRARKAVRESELRRMTANDLGRVPPQSVLHQDLTSQSQNTTSVSGVGLSRKTEYQLGDIAEQTDLQVEGVTLTQEEWRRVYLMDSDPVNPLLVCMVCGEQQYSFGLQGVISHIEEVHPHTLSLGEQERQDILAAWDKQVAIRECFITNQLQPQSRAFTDLRSDCLAEIVVKIEAED